LFDWRTGNDEPRPTTLTYLRHSRDYNSELFITANLRGLVERDPNDPTKQRYYDTRVSTLSQLAGDWVRYTNRIVPTYRQGDVIADPEDAAVLDRINWVNGAGGTFEKLLTPDEAAVPKVTHWEIGNEPSIPVSAFGVSNSFTLNAAQFHQRYAAVSSAMKAQDPTIQVGPALTNLPRERSQFDAILEDPTLDIDFVSYHPYMTLRNFDTPDAIESHLRSVHGFQRAERDEIRGAITASGRDANAVELVASEVNVSGPAVDNTFKEGQMAHALGSVETVFSHARLGLKASHYWLFPAHSSENTEFPVYQAFAALQDHMGDTLLSVQAEEDENTRVYATRDSETGEVAVWGMNFDNEEDAVVPLAIEGLTGDEQITLFSLGALSGDTTLFSGNFASTHPGGARTEVGWTMQDLTGLDLTSTDFPLPAAELQLLLIQPIPEPSVAAVAVLAGMGLLRRKRPSPPAR
jgi:hypothetical protein